MTLDDIRALVAKGESECLELKQSTKRRVEAAKAVCAMLNQKGGHVLFGVTPAGEVVGQQVSERTIEEVSEALRVIRPQAYPSVTRVPLAGGRDMVVVEVKPGPDAPYSHKGEAYRRIGNTTVAMSVEEHRRMIVEQAHSAIRWENRLAAGWSLDDLDVQEIRDTIADANRVGRLPKAETGDPIELLRRLGVWEDGSLLNAAVVLFGKEGRLTAKMPQCVLKVIRFRGPDLSNFEDNRRIHGNAFSLLRSAERFMDDRLPIAGRIPDDSFIRVDTPLYPVPARREAVVNAICHRDYSVPGGTVGVAIHDDRMEVTSTGTMHFGLTPESLLEEPASNPWNPLIAGVFYWRGIIEQWGRGLPLMRDESLATGLPPPEILEVNGSVRVRFRNNERIRSLPARQQSILELLGQGNRALALREICTQLGVPASDSIVRKDLHNLRTQGLVSLSGHGRGARWKRRW